MYRSLGSNRLQKRRATLTELGIDIYCFWPESQMDLFKNKLKPNDLINWLICQEMLLRIIRLRLMDMCCATKQFSATKISNRKIKIYLLSDVFFQQKSPRWIFLAGARDVVWYHCYKDTVKPKRQGLGVIDFKYIARILKQYWVYLCRR